MSFSNMGGIEGGFKSRKKRWYLVVLTLTILILMMTLSLLGAGNQLSDQGAIFVIRTLRLPRILVGALVGMAFGMAGSTFQTILRNPLASPDIIGVTAGTSTAAVFCILVLNLRGLVVSLVSVAFGLMISVIIYLLSRGGQFSGGRLVLIGIGVQAMMNSVTSFLLLRANQYDVPGVMRWLSGSLNTMRMAEVPRLALVVFIFGLITVILGKHLQILELGEQAALSLGVRTDLARLLLIGSAVIMIAFSTAVSGPIAFVAFLSGPIAKKMVGSGLSHAFPAGLVGALLVLTGDFIGQYLLAFRLPVGVITGILGAPYLLILLIRLNRTGGTT